MRIFDKTFYAGWKGVKFHVTFFDRNDTQVAILSGKPYDNTQFLYLDYDQRYEPEECEWITKEYSRKRAIIAESSPNRYWYLCFSPFHIEDILEIMWHSQCDKVHCSHMFRDGYVGIRISAKVKGYPKVVKVIKNQEGKNFYNFDMERAFVQAIKTGVPFGKSDVFQGLIKESGRKRREVDDHEL